MVSGRLVVKVLQWIQPVGVIPSTHLHHASSQHPSLVNEMQRDRLSRDATAHRRQGIQVTLLSVTGSTILSQGAMQLAPG